ncbi:MgtC/SapB family protein [Radiobacillus sp. PE A8.2]|uniref:MgtC/SapB family protein n=1 Tax=Radiobacillus sp. PE A8.2 TaxID=3380349 RepID=UPI00388FA397
MDLILDKLINDEFLLIASRLIVALLLAGIIGIEREFNNHSAGFRTHILVGVSSCLMMLLSLYGFEEYISAHENSQFDPARIPSYVISGIGFLGAGTIIVNGMTVRGLTTAASIWAVAGLGLVVGAGMYAEAIFTTFIILISLALLNNFETIFHKRRNKMFIQMIISSKFDIDSLTDVFQDLDVSIHRIRVDKDINADRVVLLELKKDKTMKFIKLYDQLSKLAEVRQVKEWQ